MGLALLLGCLEQPDIAERPLVVVSVLPQAFFVERIAGDLARVEVMIPPGASPHIHEPTISGLEAVAEAILYVKVGHPRFAYERAWLDSLLADRPDLPVVDASDGLDRSAEDPHLWLSPRHARRMSASIHAALFALLPAERETLGANLDALSAEIDAVDRDLGRLFAGKQGGTFVVFHPAWGHLADDYGLVQLAIEREGKEPTPRELALVVEKARSAGVGVVFVQPQLDRAAAEVIAAEIGARVEILDPLAYEWSDNLRRVGQALADAINP